VLKSIRRSGRRAHDAKLPQDEVDRQFAHLLPFGTQSDYAFEEAEPFHALYMPHELEIQSGVSFPPPDVDAR
jgi:hypothetical protein